MEVEREIAADAGVEDNQAELVRTNLDRMTGDGGSPAGIVADLHRNDLAGRQSCGDAASVRIPPDDCGGGNCEVVERGGVSPHGRKIEPVDGTANDDRRFGNDVRK